VAALGCIITGLPAQVAHTHGGSVSDVLGPDYRSGMSQRQNHWLVLPLCPELHLALDRDVRAWELRWHSQILLLEELCFRLSYCVFQRAGISDYQHRFMDCPNVAGGRRLA
jgi:hypothetical protein